jgi:hypothetical protein
VGSPTSAAPPDTLRSRIGFPLQWRDDGVIIGVDDTTGRPVAIRVGAAPSAVDLVRESAWFFDLSPDGRWVAYLASEDNQVWLAPYPATGRRFLVHRVVAEPLWLSPTELLYLLPREGVFYRVRIDAAGDPPFGHPQLWLADSLFIDTPGRSYAVTNDGSVLYVQGQARERGSSVRVVPNWVERMKRAVDEANR